MRDKLKEYVSQLFAGTQGTEDMAQEILQNTLDRYDDLIARGVPEEEAYRQTIAGIGDIDELLGKVTVEKSQAAYTSMGKRMCNAVAVALYILSPIPLFLFQNALGLCCLLGMVACGVVIQVLAGKLMDHLAEHDPLSSGGRTALNVCAIALYILCPVPLFLFQDEAGLCCLLSMVAVGVAMQIIAGKNTSPAPDVSGGSKAEVQKSLRSLIGVLTLALYLLVSFLTHAWWITWVIFPIADALTKLILALVGKSAMSKALRSVIITLAICCLALVLLGGKWWPPVHKYVISSISDGTCSSSQSFDASEVQSLYIDWVDGAIRIQQDSGSTLRYTVTGGNADTTAYSLENGTLTISCSKNSLFSLDIRHGKNLTVTLPENWVADTISVSAVSAPIQAEGLHAKELHADTVSGTIELSDIRAEKLDLSSTSARITCSGTAQNITLDTVSGSCTLELMKNAEKIQMDSVSGNLDLLLPKQAGFILDLDTVSGKFRSDFEFRTKDGRYSFGDGSCTIDADTVSGSVNIRER